VVALCKSFIVIYLIKSR